MIQDCKWSSRLFRNSFPKVLFFLMLIGNSAYSQSSKSTGIQFIPLYNNQPLKLESSDEGIMITTLKFYISQMQFLFDNKVVYTEHNSYHLIDASAPETMLLSQFSDKAIHYNAIQFQLGIDSLTNVAGAMGGDLDPTKGMYWTWQSGYINFKLEGTSTNCPARNHEFQFHLGGYQAPFNALQTIILKTTTKQTIKIYFDIEKYIKGLDLAKHFSVMSPNQEAVSFSKKIAESFYTE